MSELIDEINSNSFSSSERFRFFEAIDSFDGDLINRRATKIISLSKKVRFRNFDDDGIRAVLKFILTDNPVSIDLILPNMIAYGDKILGITELQNRDKLSYFFILESLYKNEILSSLDAFIRENAQKKLNEFPFKKELLDIFEILNFVYVNDLSNQSISSILSIAFYDIFNFVRILNPDFNIPFSIKELIGVVTNALEILGPRNNSYIGLRCGENGSEARSIEDLEKIFGVSDRTLQRYEDMDVATLSSKNIWWRYKFGLFAYYLIKGDKLFLTFDDCKTLIGNDYLVFLSFMHIWTNENCYSCHSSLMVDIDYYVVYDNNVISLNSIIRSYSAFMPREISAKDISKYSKTEQAIINKRYRNTEQAKQIKAVRLNKEIIDSIGACFPYGYRIGNNDDFEMLRNYLEEHYDIDTSTLTPHGVGSAIMKNKNYVLCDRGTYKSIYNCPELPNWLYEKILYYIDSINLKTIYYATLYEEFKSELYRLYIRNIYLFKGLLDRKLPEDIQTKRNYIIKTNANVPGSTNAVENIFLVIRSYQSVFSLDDLRSVFPGLEDYTFYTYLYEEEKNGLIFLSNKRFIYYNRFSFDENDVDDLEDFIEETFKINNEEILSTKIIYSRLKIINKPLFHRLNHSALSLLSDDFSFFSFIRQMFSSKYNFDRPFISKLFDVTLTVPSVLAYYVKYSDAISASMIKNVADSMSLVSTNIKMDEVHQYLSKTHVLINYSNLVIKKNFRISEEDLQEIFDTIDQYIGISQSRTIKTNKLNYDLFPSLQYPWNGHLVAGVIRTYLSDEFEVIKNSSDMRKDIYTIRRVEYE